MAKLTASDAATDDRFFGIRVAIDGDTIVVGAYKDDGGRYFGWRLGLRLPHDRRRRHVRRGGQADGRRRRVGLDAFGRSVAIDGDTDRGRWLRTL